MPPSYKILMNLKSCDKTKLGITLATLHMSAVCGCIGHASHFLVALDSVVDNLLPAALPYLLSVYSERARADQVWEWVVSMRVYGLALGSVLAVIISSYCGRRKPLVFGMTMQFFGAILSAFVRCSSVGIYLALIGQCINGLGSGLVQVIGSSMMAEVPAARHRGTVLATHTMWACAGEFFGLFISMDFALGNERHWPLAFAVPASVLPVCILCVWKSAESPRHLAIKNKLEEAKKALQYYQISEECDSTMLEILSETRLLPNQIGFESTWYEPLSRQLARFKDGLFIRPLLVATFTQGLVHLNDWLWISYSTQVFINSGIKPTIARKASLLMAIPQALVSIALIFCFENFSRRILLMVPTVGSIFCGLAAVTKLKKRENIVLPILSSLHSLPIIAAIDLCFAAVASESAYTVTSELFLQTDRAMGTAVVTFIQNIFGGLLTTLQLSVINERGAEYVLVPFAIINIFYVLGVFTILPETAHKTFQIFEAVIVILCSYTVMEISNSFSRQLPGTQLFRSLRRFFKRLIKTSSGINKTMYKLISFQNIVLVAAESLLFLLLLHTSYQFIVVFYLTYFNNSK